MLLHHESQSSTTEIEDLFPRHPQPLVSERASEILQSHMISGFERAIELGMAPAEALSIVLFWVSGELVRVNMNRGLASAEK